MDHRTLVAQRDEALELATAARERGDEGAELHETVRAMSLDRPPLPQLSLGAWQLKERGIEVAAVRVWHEVKDRAAEVTRMAQELTGQVRDWLDRAAERVMDRLGSGSGRSNPSWRLPGAVMAERKNPTLPRGCATHGKRGRAVKRNRTLMRRSGRHRRLRKPRSLRDAGFGGTTARGGGGDRPGCSSGSRSRVARGP